MAVAKYDAVTEWLLPQAGSVRASFDELDQLVRGGLPDSARQYREWWANTRSNPQARGWMNAGRAVESVNLTTEVVHFAAASATSPPPQQAAPVAVPTQKGASQQHGDPRHEWHWEGNVQAAMVDHLVAQGWSIVSSANTATKEAGIDVLAEGGGTRLAVEVKGYPSETYMSGKRLGQPKTTRPPTQARHWYAGALLTTMLTKGAHPDWTLALAFPDFPTYRSLLKRTASSLRALDVDVYLVSEVGRVAAAELD